MIKSIQSHYFEIKKELVAAFDEKIAAEGTTRTEVLRNAIKDYLEEK